jgi:hypothetical protein
MNTVEGVYRTIEEILGTNLERKTKRILSDSHQYTNSGEMQQDLGRIQGYWAALRDLRSTLGYDPDTL